MSIDTVNSRTPRTTREACRFLEHVDILGNPYFARLRDGGMSLPEFRRSQEQFYFAVLHFSRPMLALLARMPDPLERLPILENVVEEHGNFHCKAFHEATFRCFLTRIQACVDGVRPGPAVSAFNATLDGVCGSSPIETGLACLGVIEYAFADISAFIGVNVLRRGWIMEEMLVHYKKHSEIDKEHAEGLFGPIESKWDNSVFADNIETGLQMGVYIFDRLYRDLGTC